MAGFARPFFVLRKKSSLRDRRHVGGVGANPSPRHRDAMSESQPIPTGGTKMTTIEKSQSAKTTSPKTSWFRRAVLGTAFAAVGMVTLGAATQPAQAYWYHYGWYHPYYSYYHPYYGGYGYYNPAYYGGYGWRHWGWYHHW
jgi:hypothetical protein